MGKRAVKKVATSRPAESATGIGAVIAALLLTLGFDQGTISAVVLVVGAIPGIVTGAVTWYRNRRPTS